MPHEKLSLTSGSVQLEYLSQDCFKWNCDFHFASYLPITVAVTWCVLSLGLFAWNTCWFVYRI